jgi:G3E family GTPase
LSTWISSLPPAYIDTVTCTHYYKIVKKEGVITLQQIPVIIISGFLGSGKTTLLLRLMKDAKERALRFGVLMNELGKADVDGTLIRSEDTGFALEKLFDGCICCDKKSEIAQSLMQLVEKQPDVIFIELTGVANPEEIADSLTEPKLRHVLALNRIVTVLDAELTLEYNSIFSADKQLVHTLRRQMETADLILVNKTDLVSSHTTDKVLKTIRKHNGNAVPLLTSYSVMDTSLLLDSVKPRSGRAAAAAMPRFQIRSSQGAAVVKKEHGHEVDLHGGTEHEEHRSYSRLQTLSLNGKEQEILSRRQVEAFVKQIRGQVIRAKGYIQSDKGSTMSLYQFAGKRMNWDPTDYTGIPYLVVIGIDLNEDAIRQSWEELLLQPT